jgi:integrase
MKAEFGHIYRRGAKLWIKYYKHGVAQFESVDKALKKKGSTEADAKALLRKRLRGHGSASEERVTYAELENAIIEDYELRQYRSLGDLQNVRLKHIRVFFRHYRALDITTPRLRQYAAQRRRQGAANETINRELSVIRRMFRLAIQDRTLSQTPHVPMVERGQPREVFLTPAEFSVIVPRLDAETARLVRWVWNTGWRITAACKLEWRDVNRDEGWALLRRENSKNKREQRVPLVGELAEIIEGAHAARRLDQPRVFHHSEGRPFRRESVWRAFKKACVRAGIGVVTVQRNGKDVKTSNRTLHDMRRSAARDLIRTGVVSEDVARKITGHRTREVFSRYNISADADLVMALAALQEHRAANPGVAKTVTELSPSRGSARSSAISSHGRKGR